MKNTIGRNDPCPCNSGKKYKKCCEERTETAHRLELEKQAAAAAQKMASAPSEEKPSPAPGHSPKSGPQPAEKKRKFFSFPKFNMSRRTGGG